MRGGRGKDMNTKREELYQLLDSLPEEELSQVADFVNVLLAEPEELTQEEWKQVRKGEKEIEEGNLVRGEDIQRRDV